MPDDGLAHLRRAVPGPDSKYCALCNQALTSVTSVKPGPFGEVTGEAHWHCWYKLEQLKRLPAFTGLDRKCPKCHGFVDTEHVDLGGSNWELGAPTELLNRKCSRCGFTWRESTLDTVTDDD